MTTITYEPVQDEEILFQPQNMNVEYVSKTEQINRLELHEKFVEQTKKEYADEMIRAETRTHTQKVEHYAECVKQSKIAKQAYMKKEEPKYTYSISQGKLYRCEKKKCGRWYSIVEQHDKDRPTNFQILMMWCNL
tara:strand:- start:1600 stop:2004 length:405 start_codon:yes stop_codon:yes gene_type:complete